MADITSYRKVIVKEFGYTIVLIEEGNTIHVSYRDLNNEDRDFDFDIRPAKKLGMEELEHALQTARLAFFGDPK